MVISRSILLTMKNVSDKSCRENQKTSKHTFYFQRLFFPENRAVYEIMWKNAVEADTPHMTIWRIRIACWIPKATDTQNICNTYCFPTATMVALTRLNVTLYAHCLSLLLFKE